MRSTLACALLLGLSASLQAEVSVTFSKDVAPILYQHCAVCHHPNDIAPMSLLTYKDVRPWAAAIREAVVTRKMPPWHADPHVGSYMNNPQLAQTDIDVIETWVKAGAPEGEAKDLPAVPVFREGWHINPDVVLSIPETSVAAGNQDDYEYIYVPTNFAEDKWVQVAEVVPGDKRIVHHATVSVVGPEKVPGLKAKHSGGADQPEGKNTFRTGKVEHVRPEIPIVNDGCSVPSGGGYPGEQSGYLNRVPGIYLPGHLAETRPPGYALKVPAGSYLQFQIHYSNRLNQTLTDKTSIGLIFAKEPVQHEVAQYEIWNNLFQIPPAEANHEVKSCYTLDRDLMAVAYTAHMHFRGKDMKTEAIYPDGRHEMIFSVPNYDFRWQETYFLKNQFVLPKGTKLVTTAHFDNSANNPLNPDPSKSIRWGEPSDEEMMGFWLAFSEVTPLRTENKRMEATR